MNLLDRANHCILLFVDTFRQVPKGRIWIPLMGYFLLQWFVLYAHHNFLEPPFYTFISSWVSLFGSEQAVAFSHYPQHFLLLGQFSFWAKLGIGLVLEGLVLGTVVALFHRCFTGEPLSGDRRRSLSFRWMNLIIVWAVINGLTLLASMYFPGWFESFLNSPRRLAAFNYVFMPLVYTFVFGLFFLAIPAVVLFGENALAAMVRSLKLFLQRPFTILFLAAVILAVPIVLGILVGSPVEIVDSFKPELIYWLLVVSLFADMVANFFWMGTAVRFLSEPQS